jgi:TolB-like protein
MGKVYRARDPRLNREVAVKVLPAQLLNDANRMRRLKQEARTAGSLNHPNILAIHDIGEHEGSPFVVSELLRGQTLRQRLGGRALPTREVLDYGIQIARGLAAAHRKGIVHRDLKPENLFITDDGFVKILDFGLAKETHGFTELDSKGETFSAAPGTLPGTVLGTLGYMSPEQVSGRAVDHRSDIFSFGVILFEMVTGRRAFKKATGVEEMAAILNEEPPVPETAGGSWDRGLNSILQRCLAKEEASRYQDTDELVASLDVLQSGVSMPIAEDTPGRAWRDAPRRAWWLIFLSLFVATAVLGGILLRGKFEGTPSRLSVVVLPFEAYEPGDDSRAISDGLTEGVINRLAGLDGLRVIPRATAFHFKNQDVSLSDLAASLSVDMAVTGRVVDPSGLSVQLEVSDLNGNHQIFGERVASVSGEFVDLETALAAKIATVLGVERTVAEQAKLEKRHTSSEEAYRLYLKGRLQWAKHGAGFREALALFEQAIEEDPTYALAYSGLADSHGALVVFGYVPASEGGPRWKEAARRALAFDDSIGEAHVSLAMVHLEYDWDWLAAEREFIRGLELEPDYANGHRLYGLGLCVVGRFEEGLERIRRALDLDPLNPSLPRTYVEMLFRAGRLDEVEAFLRNRLAFEPDTWARGRLSAVLRRMGREDEAFSQRMLQWEELGVSQERISEARDRYQSSGFVGWDRMMLNDIFERQAKGEFIENCNFAVLHTRLGEFDEALQALEKALPERETGLIWLQRDHTYDPIRADPRFQSIVDRVGLPNFSR